VKIEKLRKLSISGSIRSKVQNQVVREKDSSFHRLIIQNIYKEKWVSSLINRKRI